MEGRTRLRISCRSFEGTGSSSQVLRGQFLKTYFISSSDTAWKVDKYNSAKSGYWTFSFHTSKFFLIFVILEIEKSKKHDGDAVGKVVLHSFLVVRLWRGKVLHRIPQRRMYLGSTDIWPDTRWYCTSSVQTSKYHGELADQS